MLMQTPPKKFAPCARLGVDGLTDALLERGF